jgi:hypothetical protein
MELLNKKVVMLIATILKKYNHIAVKGQIETKLAKYLNTKVYAKNAVQ